MQFILYSSLLFYTLKPQERKNNEYQLFRSSLFQIFGALDPNPSTKTTFPKADSVENIQSSHVRQIYQPKYAGTSSNLLITIIIIQLNFNLIFLLKFQVALGNKISIYISCVRQTVTNQLYSNNRLFCTLYSH